MCGLFVIFHRSACVRACVRARVRAKSRPNLTMSLGSPAASWTLTTMASTLNASLSGNSSSSGNGTLTCFGTEPGEDVLGQVIHYACIGYSYVIALVKVRARLLGRFGRSGGNRGIFCVEIFLSNCGRVARVLRGCAPYEMHAGCVYDRIACVRLINIAQNRRL